MKKEKIKPDKKQTLRSRAETKLKKKKKEEHPAADADLRKLLHELQVHQVELEMQNDELRRAQQEPEKSNNDLRTIMDHMQAGLILVDPKTHRIVDINAYALDLIGSQKGQVINNICHKFICPAEIGKCPITDLQQEINLSERVLINANGEHIPILKSVSQATLQGRTYLLESFIDISGRKRDEDALQESEKKYCTLVERANDGIIIVQDAIVRFANQRMAELDGSSVEQLVNTPFADHVHPEELPRLMENYQRRMAGENIPAVYETVLKRRDGSFVPAELSAGIISYQGRPANLIMVRDITERKQLEQRQQLSVEVMRLLNEAPSQRDIVCDILQAIRKSTGIEACGIRLKEGDDFPYYKTSGFSDDFVEAERYLCSRDESGNLLRDSRGNVFLECMCGNILSGRVDPRFTFITEGGSFWTNCTTELLMNTTEAERQTRMRNRCNEEGYESVALIPLRSEGQVIGLLQLNDRLRGCFSPDMIEFFEGLGESIGIAIARKQAENSLRESEERFRSVMEKANDAIFIVDSNGNIKFWNRKAGELYGYGADEMLGNSSTLLIPERFRGTHEKWLKQYQTAQTALAGSIGEGVNVRKGGSEFYVESSTASLLQDGEQHFVVINRDISERKQAETALRESAAKLRGIIERSIDSIYLIDEQGIVAEWNQGAEKTSLLSRGNAVGRPIWEVLFEFLPEARKTPDAHEMLKQMTLEALQTGQSPWLNTLHEHAVLRHDKTERMIQEYTFPIRTEHGFMICTISRDITDTRRMEEQLRQSQKMESIGTLAGGIAHDFNNILAAIMGNTEMALQMFPEYSTAHKHLEQVLKSSDRAKNLVKQILAFSRKSEEDREPLEMKRAVSEVTKMLRSTLPANIEIRENITSDAWIMGSVIQMHQVLLNLCTNAYHAMREKGGVLGIDLSDVNLDTGSSDLNHDLLPGDYVKLSVIDTGTGIAPEIINRIFDPFFTTKGVGEGTGMGLSVVYGIVKSHGGDITVESEPGKGTAFHILLPRTLGRAAEKEQVEQTVPRGTERILLVDDEAIIVDIGQKMLEMLGYRVTPAKGSTEALDIFKKKPDAFDLVITDYTMPKMDGYELAQKIMEIKPGIPIIMNTGYNENISLEKALAAGIREFLLKPLNLRKMGEAVRRVLDAKATGNRE